MNGNGKALVLGASGGIGGEVARRLRGQGWAVRALTRDLARAGTRTDGLDWVQGDALAAADVLRAAQGVGVIVHAVNPPGYRDWDRLVLPMLENSIAAARATGALLVLPGTVYNYGPDAWARITEASPQRPVTRKGAIRVRMEAALRAHADAGGRALVVRAGDYFGPRAGNSWLSQGMITPGRPVRRILNPARAGHHWAYLPDVAATMAALIERRAALDAFAVYQMAGHWDPDGLGMARAIARVASRHGEGAPRIHAFPWWLARLAAPFNATMRELLEMRYLWDNPVVMDNARLVGLLGAEPRTPLDEALDATLAGLGCLPAPAREQPLTGTAADRCAS